MIKIHTWHDAGSREVKMFFLENQGDGREAVINFYTGKMQMITRGEAIPDEFIFKMPTDMAQEFMKAMAEHAAAEGIKTTDDKVREGEIKATKYHLEDMRKLLKLDGK